jgi:hypothetical protein
LCYPDKEKVYCNKLLELQNNEFLNMSLFITENRKPKNKYSLIVVGNSFFCDRLGDSNRLLSGNIYCYGVDVHTENTNIIFPIKDFPSIKQAMEYARKHKDKILKPYIVEHDNLIHEYKNVIENTNTTKWKIVVLEDEKYYYEHDYSNGIEESRYKEVVKELQILNSGVRE